VTDRRLIRIVTLILGLLGVGCGSGSTPSLPAMGMAGHVGSDDGGSSGSGDAGASGMAGATGGATETSCLQPGSTCTTSCCSGAICVASGGTSVCASQCQTDPDCNSGCCAALQDGRHVCSPSSFCAAADPCTAFQDCVANNPVPGQGGSAACVAVDSDVATVQVCMMTTGCPGDCSQCTKGSQWCTLWTQNQSSCDTYFATHGQYDGSYAISLRTAYMTLCGP
jgi:hypothetical protein